MSLGNARTAPLPPLRALQVFESAARCGSFTAAGRELGITQSAVSRQIADLEAVLRIALFTRAGPKLSLTPAGHRLADRLGQALTAICSAVAEALPASGSVVTLSMLPSVATKWLAPRLGHFIEAHPDIDLRITASRHLVDFAAEGIDAAIRYGRGRWPGLRARHLGAETVQPICTSSYLRQHDLTAPADLMRATLLYAEIEEDWDTWFAAAGVHGTRAPRGPRLGDDAAILQAALDHQGVALGRSLLVADDLAAGRLVAPFPITLKASYEYWLVRPEDLDPTASLRAVEDWIVASFNDALSRPHPL